MSRTGKMLWLAPSAIAAAAASWEAVRHQPAIAVLLGDASVLLTAARPVTRVITRPVERYLEQLSGSMGMVHYLTRYDRRYCAWVATRLNSFDATGRLTAPPYTPRLDEVFVEPTLRTVAPPVGDGTAPAGVKALLTPSISNTAVTPTLQLYPVSRGERPGRSTRTGSTRQMSRA